MNSNLLRHKFLGILSNQYINANMSSGDIGVPFKKLILDLESSENVLRMSILELKDNNEIIYAEIDGIGNINATDKGVSSYDNKKYWNLYMKKKIDNIKDIVQILIPVLALFISLVLAISSVFINIKANDFNKSNELRQLNMEQRIEKLEKYIEKNHLKVLNAEIP